MCLWFFGLSLKSRPLEVAFKWSRGDKVLLPALSGVAKTCFDIAKVSVFIISSKLFVRFSLFVSDKSLTL